jgi:hypothetical protein
MFLSTKKLAFLGLLLAITVMLVVASGILEFNTLFLLVAASFCIGVAIRECGLRYGIGFYIASVLLSFILAPNKLYVFTFLCFGLYLSLTDLAWEVLARHKTIRNTKMIFWFIRFFLFNLLYIPIIILLPNLFFQGKINTPIIGILLLGGQFGLVLYDRAYNYFQNSLWNKIRTHFHFD